jgi:hypothetical protein
LIVAEVRYHDKFQLVRSDNTLPAGKSPKEVAAAASSQMDKQGKEWNNPCEWLASFNIKSIKKRWMCYLPVLASALSVIAMGKSICQLIAPCMWSLISSLSEVLLLLLLLLLLRHLLDMSP